jgi:hypothetical protein
MIPLGYVAKRIPAERPDWLHSPNDRLPRSQLFGLSRAQLPVTPFPRTDVHYF